MNSTEQMPFTKGRNFTDIWGDYTLPLLCEEYGDEKKLSMEADTIECHVCNSTSKVSIVTYPCILRPRKKSGFHGYDKIEGVVYEPNQLLAWTEFNLCETCMNKCEILMKTSDHAALGRDWWDILDSLTETLKKYNLPETEYPVSNIISYNAKTMCLIEKGLTKKSETRPRLPKDVLYVIASHMIDAHKVAAVKKIKNAYRRWRDSKWEDSKFAGNQPSFEAHYYGCRHEEWANCSDCGRARKCCDLILTNAQCNEHECDVEKWYCRDGCTYVCGGCNYTNRINYSLHLMNHVYDDSTTEQDDRTTTHHRCYQCNEPMHLYYAVCCNH